MQRLLRLRPSPGLLVALLALVLASGGAAWAGTNVTGSSKGAHKIHACIQPAAAGDTARELSLPTHGTTCPNGDVPISWNEKGRPGAKGARGAVGAQGKTGAVGAPGAQGPVGAIGPKGARGETGGTGLQGPAGANGNTVLHGEGAPSESEGAEGDFYVDTTVHELYGPKTKGSWTSATPTSLVGPQGEKGERGLQGEKGERGLQGENGLTGATGPEGPRGPAGISEYQVVHKSISVSLPNNGETQNPYVSVECPAGKSILGGGGYMSGVGGYVVNDGPIVVSGTVYPTWEVFAVAHNESGAAESGELTAVVYCAKVE